MRSVDIVAADDDDGQFEALRVCVDVHFCCSFTCSIWVCGCKEAVLEQIWIAEVDLAVHLVRRDMDESLNAIVDSAFEHDVCAFDIVLRELE